ncbi:LLM class F420-dependent oxidoreductase [Mycobacterium persicum]|nr:TIGR03619 family F420-dependent LLM class oxidoreductase [Mycobacterium persicum]ORB57818.1 LLM class F420-dependent oxidoreductase [Mycobacterium persicum]ORB93823.1 LLM class F420-dependent oxidoreductase [Mycobacterium persicum]ORC00559.1 LLM class F420-dependent oxidoreductase [Mycobacterium persicum]ORC05928.1 LLM class F420-dependent oxidoreductase [Mycobacterium persicum]
MSAVAAKLSIATPVVTMLPGVSADWERHASVEDLAQIAEAADRLGYHHLTCSEHIALPRAEQRRRGTRYWDPLATLGYLAARTQRIRLATNVLVLGYHHPLEIAKRYGTLDAVSGGRLILGVGVGSLEDEFHLIGAPFADRGARADDALRALRSALSVSEPSYHGQFYSFDGMVVDPCAVQSHVPIWVGGRTVRSLRRAATLADGWAPFDVSLGHVREWLSRFELHPGFEVVLTPPAPLDPIGEPQLTRDVLAETAAHGATTICATFVHTSRQHYLESLQALTELAPLEWRAAPRAYSPRRVDISSS